MTRIVQSETVPALHARHEKSAAVLVAIAQVLGETEEPSPEQQEFLSIYQWLANLPPALFQTVWQDPSCYHWAIISFELMMADAGAAPLSGLAARYRDVVAPHDPESALHTSLHEIRLFAAACASIARQDILFAQPLHLDLPRTLPGTGYSLAGTGTIVLHGFASGALRVSTPDGDVQDLLPDQPLDFVALLNDPKVEFEGAILWLQPSLFNLPSLEPEIRAISHFPRESQSCAAEPLSEALELIEKYAPDVFSAFREQPLIVAVKHPDQADFSNISHSILPGAFIITFVANGPELADAIIHEFHHGLLFALEEDGPFMEPQPYDPQNDCRFYSPWRDDPRPLHGILHALYVFGPVAQFWMELYRDSAQPEEMRTYALSQLHAITLRQLLAVDELERHAVFTPIGQRLFEQLRANTLALRCSAEDIAGCNEVPALCCLIDGRIEVRRDPINQEPLNVGEWIRQHARARGNDEAVAALARVTA